jgi:pimeloyl-ACP methyl ester carboxylesterase
MPTVPSTGRVSVRGVQLAYEIAGTGPEVIWGHGLSMTRVSEAGLMPLDWTRIPATVVRYDARGHGESESTLDLAAYSWAELARDQLALADALGIGPYVAAGASMGCGTALHAAAQAPGRIRALVLVIPPTGWETRAAQAEQWELSAALLEDQGPEALIAARADLDLPDPFRGDETRRKQRDEAMRAWEPTRLAVVLRGATTANLPERSIIARITVPSLILAWTGDPVHPLSTAEELDHLLPNAQLHVASRRDQLATWSGLVGDFLSASSGAESADEGRGIRR